MIIGITGTDRGTNPIQRAALASMIRHPSVRGIRHGDCVGVDAEAHEIALEVHKLIYVHPPLDPKLRAFCGGSPERVVIYEERDYLVRDRDIVFSCDHLVGVPQLQIEERRSGTWYTIRQARKANVSRTIIWPDGKIDKDGSS